TASASFIELDEDVLCYRIASPRGPQFRQLPNHEVSLHGQTSSHVVLRFSGGRRYWFPRFYRHGQDSFELVVMGGRLRMVPRSPLPATSRKRWSSGSWTSWYLSG